MSFIINVITILTMLTHFGYDAELAETQKNFLIEQTWTSMTEEEQLNSPAEHQALVAGLSTDEFIFFARVIEAESDRTNNMEGKVAVAVCIWDRTYSSSFPNTITNVLTQSGQFSTVSGGYCYTSDTKYSRLAVIKGLEALYRGDYPTNLLYFNCINYQYGTPYGCIGGNYFVTVGDPEYYIKEE